MPMEYEYVAIPESSIPVAAQPIFQHLLDTYASETNKMLSVWRRFDHEDLGFRPDPRSRTVLEILQHQLLSERRFFGEFMGLPEPPATEILPPGNGLAEYITRAAELAQARLRALATQPQLWWLEPVPFFDVVRQRIWVFWRRLLHSCHHRTQLTVYLRMMNRAVPPMYGPTADVSWTGADPTQTVEAAARKGKEATT